MKLYMNNAIKIGLTIVLITAVALLAALWATTVEPRTPMLEPRSFPFSQDRISFAEDLELFYTVKTVISSVNMTLVIFLLGTYVSLYRKTKSEFVIGLIVFALILLLYTLVSNPIVIYLFGFQPYGLGPFAMLPDLFTLLALGVLLYLTLKY
jgi:flagellar biosynthesis protein FlhB